MSEKCFICGRELPNRWAVAKREFVEGEERCYCALHTANRPKVNSKPKIIVEKAIVMEENMQNISDSKDQSLIENATRGCVKRAWTECSQLVQKLGGGVKSLWSKIHPDRSPAAMLAVMDQDLEENTKRLEAVKPELDRLYKEIVSKKKEYEKASPVRQRFFKTELQTLMAKYKGLEREFSILCENERSIDAVKSRFLEVLAYDKRGRLDVGMVDRLADNVDDKADEAEDIQDALSDLERAGKRKDRTSVDFDGELAGFDGELGLSEFGSPDRMIDDSGSDSERRSGRVPAQDAGRAEVSLDF